jgi:16S rRNA (uracil1498-N3)-methyltransferase
MSRYDFQSPRLFISKDLSIGAEVAPNEQAAHYLRHVLRLEEGANVLVFNGRDGEWQARLVIPSKRELRLEILNQTRPQSKINDLHYAFAPIKHARLDFVVQKAVELGAGRLIPVITQHTQVTRVNLDRMKANVIEAAEQCGIIALPVVEEPIVFPRWLEALDAGRVIVFCDEDAEIADPMKALAAAPDGPITLIAGPEGGFSKTEREKLLARSQLVRLSLGPRILRADTAAVAALAIVQAVRGDWR